MYSKDLIEVKTDKSSSVKILRFYFISIWRCSFEWN